MSGLRCFTCHKPIPPTEVACPDCGSKVERLEEIKVRRGGTVVEEVSYFDQHPHEVADTTPGYGKTRLVGWIVSFTKDPGGNDYRVREGRNVVGSDVHCDIHIPNDRSVSGIHAIIMCRDGKVYIRDNDSMNGTFVEDTDIFGKGSVQVKDKTRIRLGDSEFTFHMM